MASPHSYKQITMFLKKNNFFVLKKALQRYIGFLNYYKNYIPRLARRLKTMFQLPERTKNKDKIIITTDPINDFREINDVLDKCCQLTLRHSLPNKHLILMTHSGFQAVGYLVPTEDDLNQKFTSSRKPKAQ